MKTSVSGVELIKEFEGFRTMPYKDIVGQWTVGYGHLLIPGDGCALGSPITMGQATSILVNDLYKAEQAINQAVKVSLTQNQFDALVSFTFNLGVNALGTSTLLKLLNEGNYQEASEQFARWDHAGTVEVASLKQRRLKEAALFMES